MRLTIVFFVFIKRQKYEKKDGALEKLPDGKIL